jgi:hypothetical protein
VAGSRPARVTVGARRSTAAALAGAHPGFERLMQRVAVALGKAQQPHRQGLTLDEGADGRLLVPADDQISFPMSCLAAVLRLEGPLPDREHRLLEPGTAPVAALMRAGDHVRCAAATGAAVPAGMAAPAAI